MASSITIKQLNNSDFPRWDAYVQSAKLGTFFHLSGWKTVIEKAFGHGAYYLYAEDNGHVVGVLPLGHIKSILFGNALMSVPFCVYGGVLAEDDDVKNLLITKAQDLARSLNVGHMELRHLSKKETDWPGKELYVTFRKPISNDTDENMAAIPRKQRAMVRKGIKAGLRSELDADVNRFYQVYSCSVRNHGTPVFAEKYFRMLKEVFADACEIAVVLHEGKPISSVMSFYYKNEVLPYYGGGTEVARQTKAFDFMYWDVMCRASQKGIDLFDYGRSKIGTGSYSFKKNWGFTPQPLHYEYYLVNSASVPNVNPMNPKYRLFINAWKRLPLWLSNSIGPMVAKNLG